MTPTDLETYIRQRYNAVGDNFFPQAEIFNFLWKAQMELAVEFDVIKRVYTTVTVASQRAYDWPTNAIKLIRMTYDGEKLEPNDFSDDDTYTGSDENETVTGRPYWYQQFGTSFYLRPVPGTAEAGMTIKLYTSDMPSVPVSAGTLDVPAQYHVFLADYALHAMCSQDQNANMADRYLSYWQESKKLVQQLEKKKLSADRLPVVRDIETMSLDVRFR